MINFINFIGVQIRRFLKLSTHLILFAINIFYLTCNLFTPFNVTTKRFVQWYLPTESYLKCNFPQTKHWKTYTYFYYYYEILLSLPCSPFLSLFYGDAINKMHLLKIYYKCRIDGYGVYAMCSISTYNLTRFPSNGNKIGRFFKPLLFYLQYVPHCSSVKLHLVEITHTPNGIRKHRKCFYWISIDDFHINKHFSIHWIKFDEFCDINARTGNQNSHKSYPMKIFINLW